MTAESLRVVLEDIIKRHGPSVEVVYENNTLGQMSINGTSYNKEKNKLILKCINYSSLFY